MIVTKTTKGLKERPMLFGIRGSLIMIMVGVMVVETLFFLFLMVVLFFAKEFGFAFLALLFWFIFLVAIAIGFRMISTNKPYKAVKKRADIISNKDLKDYL